MMFWLLEIFYQKQFIDKKKFFRKKKCKMNICEKRKSDKILSFFITLILLAFLGLVFYINLSCNPQYYNGDIYTDINYAKTAWEAKSIFPSNWVFGNQLYVAATPNLASLLYGITNNPIIAMAIASCIMTVITVLSYDYMTNTVFSYNVRIIGFFAMAALMLNTLMRSSYYFTMASFYSCYLITVFITYGCYLRIKKGIIVKKDIPMIVISVVLSFLMGMQSLRQTAIMIIPLFVVDIFFAIISCKKNKKITVYKSTQFSFSVLIANVMGLILIRFVDINQAVSSYIDIDFNLDFSSIIEKIYNTFYFSFLPSISIHECKSFLFAYTVLIVYIIGFILGLNKFIKSNCKNEDGFTLILLLLLGVLGVLAVGILSNIGTFSKYYFMVYPLLAISVSYIISNFKKLKTPILVLATIFFSVIISYKYMYSFNEITENKKENNSVYEAAEYILDNDYDTICSYYAVGLSDFGAESISVATNYKINRIFYFYDETFETQNKWFTPFDHVCIIDEYKNIDNSKCIYYLLEKNLNQGVKAAREYGVDLEPVAQFDEIVLCKASDNLLVVADELNNK